jgi:CBS domain-containing protein
MALRDDLRRVRLASVMTRGPATVEEAAPLADAAAEMAAGGFRHVPVVDGGGRLAGMVSERDLRMRLGTDVHGIADAAGDALSQPVNEVMTPDPISLPPTATLAEALAVFADDRVGAIPVVDEGDRPIGIVSYVDLLGTIRKLSEQIARSAPRAPAPPAPGARRAIRHRSAARGPRARGGSAPRRAPGCGRGAARTTGSA